MSDQGSRVSKSLAFFPNPAHSKITFVVGEKKAETFASAMTLATFARSRFIQAIDGDGNQIGKYIYRGQMHKKSSDDSESDMELDDDENDQMNLYCWETWDSDDEEEEVDSKVAKQLNAKKQLIDKSIAAIRKKIFGQD